MSETVRTFIAIEMPESARAFLARCQDRLKGSGGTVRWLRPELIHLTLVFLGEVAAARLPAVEAAVREAAGGFAPLTLEPRGVGRFPPRGRPRVVWVGIDEPTGGLVRLQKAVADATAAFAEKVEDRAYAAHLTLGRVQGGDVHALGEAVDAMADERGRALEAREVVVFRSVLAPGGPTYTAMAKVALAGKGASS